MTLPAAPNPVSMNQVNVELGAAGTTSRSLNESVVRVLAGPPTTGAGTAISMSNLRGKSAAVPLVVNGFDVNDEDFATGTAYTGNWFPEVQATGGVPGYTYLWTFTSNPNAFTLVSSNGAVGQVSHSITKFGFTGSCVLNCQVTDSASNIVNRSVTVNVNIIDPGA
jgi:hypothetical protein